MTSYLKTPRLRSRSYLMYVSAQPCFACGIEGFSQAAHANNGKGLALKTCDLQTFPLCCARPGHMGCHTMHDMGLDMTRDQRREREAWYVARMQEQARRDGRPEFAEAA